MGFKALFSCDEMHLCYFNALASECLVEKQLRCCLQFNISKIFFKINIGFLTLFFRPFRWSDLTGSYDGSMFVGNKAKERISRKQSTPNFPEKEHFLPPDTHTYVCVWVGKKCSFFRKICFLCFLITSVLRCAFLPYYWRVVHYFSILTFSKTFTYTNVGKTIWLKKLHV